MSSAEKEKIYFPMFIFSIVLVAVNVWWFGYGFFRKVVVPESEQGRMLLQGFNTFLVNLNGEDENGFSLFMNPYVTKLLALVVAVATFIIKAGKKTSASWPTVLTFLFSGLVMYLFPLTGAPFLYVLATVAGFILLCIGIALMGRKFSGAKQADNDVFETFEQCVKKPIETPYSINIPVKYQYKKKNHSGYIPFISPQAGTLILGAPGTGKSFSIVHTVLETMIKKGFSLYCYDFKLPDLTNIVYNKYLQHYEFALEKVKAYSGTYEERLAFDDRHRGDAKKTPQFCLINFDNPRQSMRCNPMSPRYLNDMTDAHELANVLMAMLNPKSIESEDFFVMSAKAVLASDIWLLRKYKNGIYCTFPHLIELLGQNYKATFDILQKDEELWIMVQPFSDALKDNAQEQLQGQIASARMPLLKFPSDSFYWVLTGDDFTLDINNPDDPKILCIGNNPDRQAAYGPALSLYTSRIIKVVNHKTNIAGKRNNPCGLVIDEFPTNYIHQIDNVIATARSNDVCVVLAAQDKSQVRRDYGDKNAEVIFNTVGNIFSGRVNGETAKSLAETFGEQFRLQESETTGGESDTVSSSFHLEKILPQTRIETLTNGYFFGKVADTNAHPIEHKLFCGKVQVDVEERKKDEAGWRKLPDFGAHYFNDALQEQYVNDHEKECIIGVIKKNLMQENYDARLHDPEIEEADPVAVAYRASLIYAKLTPEERADYKAKAVKQRQDQAMKDIMKANANKIRTDILEIFKYYGIDLDDEKYSSGKKNTLPDDIEPTPPTQTMGSVETGSRPDAQNPTSGNNNPLPKQI